MDNVLRQHQLMATEALIFLSELCDSHNVRYYLIAGSCLGAIRHKGFIPWDDDIDVGVISDDYEKLEALIVENLPNKYEWISENINPKYPRSFGKITHNGIALIDIFRLAHFPRNKYSRAKMWTIKKVANKLLMRKCGYTPKKESRISYYCSNMISQFVPLSVVRKMARNNEFRYPDAPDYINLYSIYSMEKEFIKGEWLNNPTVVEFESRLFKTVSDPDEYLTHLYGDYMIIPDENSRKSMNHFNVVFDIGQGERLKHPRYGSRQ